MAKATDYLTTITANIETLGYTFTNEVFGFDSVPSSKLNKAYRFELNTDSVVELSGSKVDKKKKLDVWFAFKIKASKDNLKSELIAIYDLQEKIEDRLLDSLVGLDSIVLDTLESIYTDNHIIIQIGFEYTYRRDLNE